MTHKVTTVMTYQEAFRILDIEDYGKRIFHSNSHGELFHLQDYIEMASRYPKGASWFRPLFIHCVEFAKKHWERPESCFQYMPEMMKEAVKTK